MRNFCPLLLFMLLMFGAANGQTDQKIECFHLHDVRLLDGPFKHAQDLNINYLLELNADRLLAPFMREAGLPLKAESYANWENTGLDGHIGGHYLSALSLMYASTQNSQIKQRLDYMVDELNRCQQANGDGYIGGVPGGKNIWCEVRQGRINAGSFDLNGKWVPLYNIHKTYAGLRDAWLIAGNEKAKEMLICMTDWAIRLVENLTEDQIQDMLRSEHGGLNETFADVAVITGNEKYLKLARQFSHQIILNPLIRHEDQLTGMHANTQIPKVLGFKRIADVEHNGDWESAAQFFWETVVDHRSVCIGGNSVSEHFNPTDDFSRVIESIEGPETCNTYNMMRLSKMLYQTSLDSKYIDYYERALYNHILSTQNPTTGGLVYFTQMRPGHYRVYSQPHQGMWCCVGSGMENHSKYGEMIYAHTADELYVNLFIPSVLNWEQKQTQIVQQTSFPDEAKTTIVVNPIKKKRFAIHLRQPKWVDLEKVKITVNGTELAIEPKNHYWTVNRTWKPGDRIVIELPMTLTAEQLPDHSHYFSFMYGPIVLAAKTNTDHLDGLFADDSRGGHIAKGQQTPLREMPIVVGDPNQLPSLVSPVEGKNLTFSIKNLYSNHNVQDFELIPFFRLHESRYIVYWAQASADEVAGLSRQIALEEQERIHLDGVTIDRIACGEQQPESDHFIVSENSRTGAVGDVHWRDAKGWFSYRMQNINKKTRFLYLQYFDGDKNCQFDVLVNGESLQSIVLGDVENGALQTLILPLTQEQMAAETLLVRFNAHSGQSTGKVVQVRLLVDAL